MPKTTYTERPHQVEAEQFLEKQPWPPTADDCGITPGIHLHVPIAGGAPDAAVLLPLHDTDWIVIDGATVRVLSDADFTATYVKKTGP